VAPAVICANGCLDGTVPADYPDYPRLPMITIAPDHVITLPWHPGCAAICACAAAGAAGAAGAGAGAAGRTPVSP
jgi:hypothetical protein